MPPTGRYIDAHPIKMHILEYGNPENPALVFIHGSGPGSSSYANFYNNAQIFAEAGYYVVLPDLIGFGYSDKPLDLGDYTLRLFCDTLMAGLKTLNIEKCHFIGNSLGGGIAIQIALNTPQLVDKLILMGPGCIEKQEDYFDMPGVAKMLKHTQSGINETTLKKIMLTFVYHKQNITDELVAMRWAIAQNQPKEIIMTMKTPNLGERLKELTCPLLTFWGANDEFMPETGKKKCLYANGQSRLIEVNSCGHWVMIEYMRMFNNCSLDFLLHG